MVVSCARFNGFDSTEIFNELELMPAGEVIHDDNRGLRG